MTELLLLAVEYEFRALFGKFSGPALWVTNKKKIDQNRALAASAFRTASAHGAGGKGPVLGGFLPIGDLTPKKGSGFLTRTLRLVCVFIGWSVSPLSRGSYKGARGRGWDNPRSQLKESVLEFD